MSDQALGIAISSCLGLTSAVGMGIGGPTGGVRRVECIRFRIGGDGYESPIDDDEEDGDAADNLHSSSASGGSIKETFDVFFAVNFGGLSGEWVAKGLETTADEAGEEATRRVTSGELEKSEASQMTPAAWKSKFLDAQRRLWESQEEVKSLKDRILVAVL
jgi:DNA polymerase III delta prime subunit